MPPKYSTVRQAATALSSRRAAAAVHRRARFYMLLGYWFGSGEKMTTRQIADWLGADTAYVRKLLDRASGAGGIPIYQDEQGYWQRV